MQFALKNLDSSDRVSLVTFDHQVELPIASTTAENKDQLIQRVKQLESRGTTNLSGGQLAGTNQVKSAYNIELLNRVILLTDGLASEGLTDSDRLSTLAREISGSVYTYFQGAKDAKRVASLGSEARYYWTRSPGSDNGSHVRNVHCPGVFDGRNARYSGPGVRPALNLKADTMASLRRYRFIIPKRGKCCPAAKRKLLSRFLERRR